MHLVLPPTEAIRARLHPTQLPIGPNGSLQPQTQLPLSDHLQQAPGLRFRGSTPVSIRNPPTLPSQSATHRVSLGGQFNNSREQAAGEEQQAIAPETLNAQEGQPVATRDPSLSERLSHRSSSSVPPPSSPNLSSSHTPTRTTRSTPEPGAEAASNMAKASNPLRRGRDSSERTERRIRRQVTSTATFPNTNPANQNLSWAPMQYNPTLAVPLGGPVPSNSHSSNLLSMQQVIIGLETQLNYGVIPPIEQLSEIRTSLYQILDAQYQNPLARRDGLVEGLLERLSSLYVRADQLRLYRARFPNPPSSNNLTGNLAIPHAHQSNLYLLSSPSGYQGLIIPRADTATVTGQAQTQATPVPPAGGRVGDVARDLPRNPDGVALNNARDQVLIHRRAVVDVGRQGQFFARNARRIWLFIRLYFFCYLFSDSGTWSRVILVCVAVLLSLLSESGAPQEIQRVVFGPIQRHLEGLVHIGGEGVNRPGQQPAGPQGEQLQNRAGGPAGVDTTPGIQQQLRRVERSVALFLASLVPGVGERHIEVRNAAEAALQNQERERLQAGEQGAEGNDEQQDTPVVPQAEQPPAEQENRAQ